MSTLIILWEKGDLAFDPGCPRLQIDQDYVQTYIVCKVQKGWTKLVTLRVFKGAGVYLGL